MLDLIINDHPEINFHRVIGQKAEYRGLSMVYEEVDVIQEEFVVREAVKAKRERASTQQGLANVLHICRLSAVVR